MSYIAELSFYSSSRVGEGTEISVNSGRPIPRGLPDPPGGLGGRQVWGVQPSISPGRQPQAPWLLCLLRSPGQPGHSGALQPRPRFAGSPGLSGQHPTWGQGQDSPPHQTRPGERPGLQTPVLGNVGGLVECAALLPRRGPGAGAGARVRFRSLRQDLGEGPEALLGPQIPPQSGFQGWAGPA